MFPIKKIVIIGPESTGKSTLASGLAKVFEEPWVEEFAREYLQKLQRDYGYNDLLEIAKGQIELEDKKSQSAKNMLFCDTDLHVIKVWSDHKFQKTHPWILDQIKKRSYDLYFLTDIDIPWQEDPLREHPEPRMRQYFFDVYQQMLLRSKTPHYLISGSAEERLDQAVNHLKNFFNKNLFES